MKQDMIVILDLGSTENTVIARQIRELGVYSEIHPHDITPQELAALNNVKGIILTATRSTEDKAVNVGEKVRVLIYRLYVFHKDKSYIVENSSMNDKNPIFI